MISSTNIDVPLVIGVFSRLEIVLLLISAVLLRALVLVEYSDDDIGGTDLLLGNDSLIVDLVFRGLSLRKYYVKAINSRVT